MDFRETPAARLADGEIVIDRPKAIRHPRIAAMVYPMDYGCPRRTTGGDGQEIDLWRGSRADGQLDAIVCAVDRLKRDAEVKLLIGCAAEEIQTVRAFLNDGDSMSAIVVERPVADDGAGLETTTARRILTFDLPCRYPRLHIGLQSRSGRSTGGRTKGCGGGQRLRHCRNVFYYKWI